MGNGGLGANQHGNMLCFGGGSTFVFVGQKSHDMKYEPQNKNLDNYHQPKHVKFRLVA
jgi:hypothetical protein